MNKEKFELYKTGIVKPELAKNVIYAFCGAVLLECNKLNTTNIIKGYDKVVDNLACFSHNWCEECDIEPIRYGENLLKYFFDQKKEIPGRVYYWFGSFYDDVIGHPTEFEQKYPSAFSILQNIYVARYREWKADDKDNERYFKKARRKTCKLFASGEYKAMFELINKPFSSYMDDKELAEAHHITQDLFCQQFMDIAEEKPDFDRTAAAFVLGRIQGERIAAERYEREQEGAAV